MELSSFLSESEVNDQISVSKKSLSGWLSHSNWVGQMSSSNIQNWNWKWLSAISIGWINCLPRVSKEFHLKIPIAPPPPRRPFTLHWEKGNQMKGSSVVAVQCSLLLCYWTPKRRIRQYQVEPFFCSIFMFLFGTKHFSISVQCSCNGE